MVSCARTLRLASCRFEASDVSPDEALFLPASGATLLEWLATQEPRADAGAGAESLEGMTSG